MRLWEKVRNVKVMGKLTLGKSGSMKVNHSDGTETTVNLGALSARVQELTSSAAVTAGIQRLTLNHATVAIASTIADAANHAGFFCILDNSASGTAAHTVTLSNGTFDGTNTVATLNAPNDMLLVHFDKAGNGVVVVNTA